MLTRNFFCVRRSFFFFFFFLSLRPSSIVLFLCRFCPEVVWKACCSRPGHFTRRRGGALYVVHATLPNCLGNCPRMSQSAYCSGNSANDFHQPETAIPVSAQPLSLNSGTPDSRAAGISTSYCTAGRKCRQPLIGRPL